MATPAAPSANPTTTTSAQAQVTLPRITITFCTQCKWLLRAAWLQQELLSTFGTSIGEIALIPATGGIFQIHLTHRSAAPESEKVESDGEVAEVLIWDRKAEQGFPEAKVLKQRVRDVIEPGRGLGHSDTVSSRKKGGEGEGGIGKVEGEGDGDDVAKKGGSGEGEGGRGNLDLAGSVREKGPSNPLVQRMRPDVVERERGGEQEGGKECEDCQ